MEICILTSVMLLQVVGHRNRSKRWTGACEIYLQDLRDHKHLISQSLSTSNWRSDLIFDRFYS